MKFGEVLRELLEERELSQKQMAEDLHIAASTFGNYVRYNREPDYETLKRIADYFDVTVDYLLDHPARQTQEHGEAHVLELYRKLPPELREVYLEQGQVLLRYSLNKEDK